MLLWKIEPVARLDDPRWQDCIRWKLVIVRAETSALAIIAAERQLGNPDRQIGNESPASRTGLGDEKLYWVRRIDPGDMPEDALDDESSPKVLLALPLDPVHILREIRKEQREPCAQPAARNVPPHTDRAFD